MGHRWVETDDRALLRCHERFSGLDMSKSILWAAIAGQLVEDTGLRVSPAAVAARWGRLEQARILAETEADPDAHGAVVKVSEMRALGDAWEQAARMAEEEEVSEREAYTREMQGLHADLAEISLRVAGLQDQMQRLLAMWQ